MNSEQLREMAGEALLRRMAAQKMCLAPHVCAAIYKGDPIPIGWLDPRRLAPVTFAKEAE